MRRTSSLLLLATLLSTSAHAQTEDMQPPPPPPPLVVAPAPAAVPAPAAPDTASLAPAPAYVPGYVPANPAAWVPPEQRLIRLQSGQWMRLREAQSAAGARVGVGTTFVILGAIFQSVAVLVTANTGGTLYDACAYRGQCDQIGTIVTVAAAGGTLMSLGIPMVLSGKRLKQELSRHQPSLALAPSTTGATIAAGFRF